MLLIVLVLCEAYTFVGKLKVVVELEAEELAREAEELEDEVDELAGEAEELEDATGELEDVAKVLDEIDEVSKKLGLRRALGVFVDNGMEEIMRSKNEINFTIPMVFIN